MQQESMNKILTGHVAVVPFNLTMHDVERIVEDICKTRSAMDHYMHNLSFFKFVNIPVLFRHAVVREHIEHISEILDKGQWFNTMLNKHCTVTPSEDDPEVFQPTDPFGWPVEHVPDMLKLVDEARKLQIKLMDESEVPTINDNIKGPWEIIDADAWIQNVSALYVQFSRVQTIPLLNTIISVCIHCLIDVCKCMGFENSFDHPASKEGDLDCYTLKLWINPHTQLPADKAMSMIASKEQVYFTKEEIEQREAEEREAARIKAEHEAMLERQKEAAEFVGILEKSVTKFPEGSKVHKVFTPGHMGNMKSPSTFTLDLMKALQRFIEEDVAGDTLSDKVDCFMSIVDKNEAFHMRGSLLHARFGIVVIKFFTGGYVISGEDIEQQYEAQSIPLMEVIDPRDRDEIIERQMTHSVDIVFTP